MTTIEETDAPSQDGVTEEVSDGALAETDGLETAADEAGDDGDELEEVEFGGRTYQAPKGLKPALMMQADYTRKTQELAEARRMLQADREAGSPAERAEAVQAGHAELARDIEGWSPGLAGQLAQFARDEFGMTDRELNEVVDPRLVKLLHAAYVGAAGRGSSRAAQRHVQAQVSRPAATLGGAGGGVRDPSRMSTDEWMRHRNNQVRKQG